MAIHTRVKLIEYCLRRLGNPVIDINIDGLATHPDGTSNSTNSYSTYATDNNDSQIQDCIDDALQVYQEFHYDAIQREYRKHQVTADEITQEWIPIPTNDYTGVANVFPVAQGSDSSSLFSLKYQLRLNELYDLSNVSLTHYTMSQNQLSMIDDILTGVQPFDYNRHMNRLYIYMDWEVDVKADDYILIEAFKIIDPGTYSDVYNDRWLKDYATALLKRQWGQNLSKYNGITLPGGITYNGTDIYSQATTEIQTLEEQIRLTYDTAPQFLIG